MSGDPNPGIFDRISLLVGEDAMDLFAKTKVILFGTGATKQHGMQALNDKKAKFLAIII